MKNTKKKGFTLVELVIVIAVIAILAGVMIATFADVVANANESSDLQEIKASLESKLTDFVVSEKDAPSGLAFMYDAGTYGMNASMVEFTNVAHDMYTIEKDEAGNKYTVTDLPAGTHYVEIGGKNYEFTTTETVTGDIDIYISTKSTVASVKGKMYPITVTTTPTTDALKDLGTATAATLYYTAQAVTADNTTASDTEDTAVCDYLYVTGRKGYVFKIVVYGGSYEVEATGMTVKDFEKEYGFTTEVTQFIGLEKSNCVAATVADVITSSTARTVTITGNATVNVTVNVTKSNIYGTVPQTITTGGKAYIGDVVTVTVTETNISATTTITINGVAMKVVAGQDNIYTFVVTDDSTVSVVTVNP